MSGYVNLPVTAGGIPIYPSAINFPLTAEDGDQAVAADTNTIYIYDTSIPGWQPVATPGAAIAITALTADVTATGPGAVNATVQFVGGATALAVANTVTDVSNATSSSTVSTLVKRDAAAKTSLKGLLLDGATSGTLTINPPNAVTSYAVTMPAAQGAASSVLQNDGAGVLSWVNLVTGVSSVSGSAPISSSGGATPTISISDFGGATALLPGSRGSVPAPAAGDQAKFLRGDATWATVDLSNLANKTLSNLDSPTAINQNLNLGSNAISRTNYTISPQLYDAGTQTTNFTLNWANGPAQKFTINAAGPLVITLSNPVTGGTYLIRIEQGATPGTVTWPVNVIWGTVGAPILSNATGEVDVVTLFYDGADYRASAVIQDALPAANYSLTNLSFAGSNGQFLTLSGGVPAWAAVPAELPSQTSNGDKVLVTNGSSVSWQYAGLGAGSLGTGNIVLGRNKPTNIGNGSYNFVAGVNAGNSLSTGIGNIAIGLNSLSANSTSNSNISIGYEALRVCTGEFNIGIGTLALTANTTATGNVFIGQTAGSAVTTGGTNVGIGQNAGNTLTTGTKNVFLGAYANCLANSTASAIVLGFECQAASNEFAIGSANGQINTMLLGRGGATQTVANSVKIMTMKASGSDTDLSAGTLTLAGSQSTGNKAGGDVIIATAPAGASGSSLNAHVERIRAKSATEVVVNDTGVDFDFRVEGDTDANLLMVDAGADKVGIGTNTPAEKLEVNGNIKATSGDVVIATAGKGLKVSTGANGTAGIVTGLSGVTATTVNTTAVLTGSLVFVQPINTTDKHGFSVSAIVNATSFTVDFSGTYTGDLAWFIINPA